MIDGLKQQLTDFLKERIALLEDSEKLYKLYQLGIIDYKGDLLPFDQKDNQDMTKNEEWVYEFINFSRIYNKTPLL